MPDKISRDTISWCCLPPASDACARPFLEKAAAADCHCVWWDSSNGAEPGALVLVFLGSLDPEVLERVLAMARRRPGRVLAAVMREVGELPLSCAMRLLAGGVGDIVPLDNGETADMLLAAILCRWQLIDSVVDSELVVRNVVGRSRAWTLLVRQVVEAARFSQAPMLITGETGTGKELIARLIHSLDTRRAPRDLITVDCTTLAPELSGSELFGHERGAFTGAITSREGAFALANGGTLFLDEIGDLPLPLQGQLLRAIHERLYKRVGGNTWMKSDFRLVCATNRDLQDEVAARRFRGDLYHRIAGITCRTPPLRERVEDIPALATHFLSEALETNDAPALSAPLLEYIVSRDYSGNVRDLRLLMHSIARHYVGAGCVTIGGIPEDQRSRWKDTTSSWRNDTFEQAVRRAVMLGVPFKDIGRAAEETAVRIVLSEAESTGQAARRLGVSPRAVQARRKAATRS